MFIANDRGKTYDPEGVAHHPYDNSFINMLSLRDKDISNQQNPKDSNVYSQ